MIPIPTDVLVEALEILAVEWGAGDGEKNPPIHQAAERIKALVHLIAKQDCRMKKLEKHADALLEVCENPMKFPMYGEIKVRCKEYRWAKKAK